MTKPVDDLVARLRAQITSYLYGSTLVHHPICLEAAARIAALEADKAALVEQLDEAICLLQRFRGLETGYGWDEEMRQLNEVQASIALTLAKHGDPS